jgi:hypothetical protein
MLPLMKMDSLTSGRGKRCCSTVPLPLNTSPWKRVFIFATCYLQFASVNLKKSNYTVESKISLGLSLWEADTATQIPHRLSKIRGSVTRFQDPPLDSYLSQVKLVLILRSRRPILRYIFLLSTSRTESRGRVVSTPYSGASGFTSRPEDCYITRDSS